MVGVSVAAAHVVRQAVGQFQTEQQAVAEAVIGAGVEMGGGDGIGQVDVLAAVVAFRPFAARVVRSPTYAALLVGLAHSFIHKRG